MKRMLILVVLLTILPAGAQVQKIIIPAGTPEDKAIQAASAETDSQNAWPCGRTFCSSFHPIHKLWPMETGNCHSNILTRAILPKHWNTATRR